MAIEGFPIQLSITCRACRQPLPVNAVTRTALCTNCGNTTALDEDFWTRVFGPEELAEALDFEPGSGTQKTIMGGMEAQIAYGRRLPRCQSCQFEIDPNVFQAAADYGALQCSGCGEHIRARHADNLVRALVPQALYVLNEGPTGTDAREQMRATEPVTFACMQCGASLQADGSSRSVQCIYCQANNYLPDGLWYRLHPPSTVRTFFIVAQIGADQRMMAQLADEHRAEEIAKGDQLSQEVALALASHKDSDVREALAENPLAPQEALRSMASDSRSGVRERVAQHQLAPPDVLTTLMNDSEDRRVRANAAANPATPVEAVAARASTEKDRDVLKAMLQRRGLHAEVSSNPSKEAKELLVEDPNTPGEVLKTLAKSDDPLIQEQARKHKNAPGSVKVKAGCWTAAVVLGIALVAGLPLGIRFLPELRELAGLEEDSADPDEFDAVESSDTMTQSERARHLDRLFGDYWDCYDEHDEGGEVKGKTILVLDTEGEVAHTMFEGSAPEPVEKCLASKLESRSLTRYGAEEPAIAIYQYSGSYKPNGVTMLSDGEELRLMEELEPEMRETVVEVLDITEAEQGG